jgi:hypothetical protein
MMHRVDVGALPDSPNSKLLESPSKNELCGTTRRVQNCSLLKTLFVKVNGPDADPGHCNPNAGDLFSTTADAVTA